MSDCIQIDPNICHGKPVFSGTRISVSTVLGALASGDEAQTVLDDYPGLTKADLDAALDFARELSDYQLSAYEAVEQTLG
jgi:uncharacterized protein (DUF433 family)